MEKDDGFPTLVSLCQEKLLELLREESYHPRCINDMCKYIPEFLLEPILESIVECKAITDVGLSAFLVPSRIRLDLLGSTNLRNSTLKQIGFRCPNMVSLNMSGCSQVSNAVVRTILQGCCQLEELKLEQCVRVTDAAFDVLQSPFHALVAFQSLEMISLQGCPQITGSVVDSLNKSCLKLNHLNLSQCKLLSKTSIQHIFHYKSLKYLNLSFVDTVDDDSFVHLPQGKQLELDDIDMLSEYKDIQKKVDYSNSVWLDNISDYDVTDDDLTSGNSNNHTGSSVDREELQFPLKELHIAKAKVTDMSMLRIACLTNLRKITLQWCDQITDYGVMSVMFNCPLLTTIDLKSCAISDSTLRVIAVKCLQLKELDISWCSGVTDEGLSYFAMCNSDRFDTNTGVSSSTEGSTSQLVSSSPVSPSSHTHKLSKLSMVWCTKMTDRCVNYLLKMSALKHVELSGCSGISALGIERLRLNKVMHVCTTDKPTV